MREITVPSCAEGPAILNLKVNRDEPLSLLLEGGSLSLTISATAGGERLVEVVGTDSLTLAPIDIQSLTEGAVYYYNLWSDAAAPVLVARGKLEIAQSISPSWANWSTTWLNNFGQEDGPQRVVVLTMAAYQALTPEDGTIYLITGG